MPFYTGLKKDSLIIINSDIDVLTDEDKAVLNKLNAKVVQFQATELAMRIAGTELATNMAMMGMVLGLTKLVTEENIEEVIHL